MVQEYAKYRHGEYAPKGGVLFPSILSRVSSHSNEMAERLDSARQALRIRQTDSAFIGPWMREALWKQRPRGGAGLRPGYSDAGFREQYRGPPARVGRRDRKSTRLNSSHPSISYAVFCLKKKKKKAQVICLL